MMMRMGFKFVIKISSISCNENGLSGSSILFNILLCIITRMFEINRQSLPSRVFN